MLREISFLRNFFIMQVHFYGLYARVLEVATRGSSPMCIAGRNALAIGERDLSCRFESYVARHKEPRIRALHARPGESSPQRWIRSPSSCAARKKIPKWIDLVVPLTLCLSSTCFLADPGKAKRDNWIAVTVNREERKGERWPLDFREFLCERNWYLLLRFRTNGFDRQWNRYGRENFDYGFLIKNPSIWILKQPTDCVWASWVRILKCHKNCAISRRETSLSFLPNVFAHVCIHVHVQSKARD